MHTKNGGDHRLKRIILCILCIMISAVCIRSTSAYGSDALNWYCPKVIDHKQPIADQAMRIIERYQGYYVDHKHGDSCEEKVVYLTFDAGYENGNVAKILDVMKNEQVMGAFFILGNLIQRNPELVSRMAEEGHLVCNHTFYHKDMTKVKDFNEFSAELKKLEALYYETTGQVMAKYYRPPEGKFNECSLEFASRLGYKTVFWSLAYADWDNRNQPDPKASIEKIMSRIHNGAVILLHPTSKTNAEILEEVIVRLKQQGYRFGSLDELTAESTVSR